LTLEGVDRGSQTPSRIDVTVATILKSSAAHDEKEKIQNMTIVLRTYI
jgi:hypothetical protein